MAPGLCLAVLLVLTRTVCAAVSTSTPSPPLQWINLSSLLSGSSPPPPLKDASIGYDEGSRTLLIFGGESEGGVPQSQTYLLNLDFLVWSPPSTPAGIGSTPPARSAAVSGDDFAASYRTGHLVAGGKGVNGAFLSDVWEFDYINQFWTPVNVAAGGPSVLAAGGGIDNINVGFQLNGSLPNNTFYAFGSNSSPVSLSDAWQLEVAGALSSNIQHGLSATWVQMSLAGQHPSIAGQGGTVNHQKLISFGGCANTATPSASCLTQNATIVDVAAGTILNVEPCVAPRLDPAVVSNRNGFSAGFANQAFVLLGTFDTSLWDDSGGLQKGEVDILDFSAATWTRVLPAGDPGSLKGTPTVPSPRAGAAALSYPSGLVGSSRDAYSDTIVFGGQDMSGQYHNDVWLLRAYNGSVSSSGAKWSGFGDGTLQTGINANGAGVTMQFLSSCVTAIANPSPSSSSVTSGTPSPTQSGLPSPSETAPVALEFHPYDTATSHKVLAPVSVAMILPAIIIHRLSEPAVNSPSMMNGSPHLQLVSHSIALLALGAGLAGLILSFTTIVATPPSDSSAFIKRSVSSDNILRTAHGQAGLALFALLYIVFPAVYAACIGYEHLRKKPASRIVTDGLMSKQDEGAESADVIEKLNGNGATSSEGQPYDRSTATTPAMDTPTSPRRRHRSLTGSSFMASLLPTAERKSTESVAVSDPSAPSGPSSSGPHLFEVVNRPRRRHLSITEAPLSEGSHRAAIGPTRRSLSDISWLERRRSVNAVGEIDYALMQLHHQRGGPPTPGTTNLSTRALMNAGESPAGMPMPMPLPSMPSTTTVLLHLLLHTLVLALSALALVALWSRAPRAAFAVFLAWTATLYALLIGLAWYGRSRDSALTVLLFRLRGEYTAQQQYSTPGGSRPLSPTVDGRGPYLHQPIYHIAPEDELGSPSRAGHVTADEADSDEDEDTRQRRIEEEMQRRDVSIVTVPKRKLWITNPS